MTSIIETSTELKNAGYFDYNLAVLLGAIPQESFDLVHEDPTIIQSPEFEGTDDYHVYSKFVQEMISVLEGITEEKFKEDVNRVGLRIYGWTEDNKAERIESVAKEYFKDGKLQRIINCGKNFLNYFKGLDEFVQTNAQRMVEDSDEIYSDGPLYFPMNTPEKRTFGNLRPITWEAFHEWKHCHHLDDFVGYLGKLGEYMGKETLFEKAPDQREVYEKAAEPSPRGYSFGNRRATDFDSAVKRDYELFNKVLHPFLIATLDYLRETGQDYDGEREWKEMEANLVRLAHDLANRK
ncbi:MAG: hypothetical protein KAT77_05960 [Nanoarchaeota archaeon]|nr:hypothetical protein [Nanoarchaeota archaeon]